MKHSEDWGQFAETLYMRLEAGEREYGDVSFTRPPAEVAAEIEQELLDVCGWAFVLWCRMRRVTSRLS